MLRKILASLFFSISVANLIWLIGFPKFGTAGFLIWINCLNIFLFIAYQHQTQYVRQAWGTTVSLMAILASVLALFRADPTIQFTLGTSSIVLSMIAFYLFALTHGTINSLYELALLPINLTLGVFHGIHHIIVSYNPKVFFPVFTLLVVILGVFSVFIPAHPLIPSFNIPNFFELNIISLGFLLFYFSFLFANVRIYNSLHVHIQPEFWTEVSRETLILVWIGIITNLGYQLIRFPYFHLISTKADLINHGLESFGHYFYRGFVEFTIVALIFYLITGISLTVLRISQDKLNLLRFSQVGLLLTLFGLFASVIRRLWLFISIDGFEPDKMFMVFLMLFMGVMTLVLITRFLFEKYVGWHVIEFLTIIVCVFILGIINVDNLYFKATQTQNKLLSNYENIELAYLSADSVNGWVTSYKYAKQNLDSLPVQNPQTWSVEHEELVKEANLILSELKQNYLDLALKYGNSQVVAQVSNFNVPQEASTEINLIRKIANSNVAEWYAYQKLNEEVPPKELAKLEQTSTQMLAYFKTKKN